GQRGEAGERDAAGSGGQQGSHGERPPGDSATGGILFAVYWSADSISSIQAALLAVISYAGMVSVVSGWGRVANSGAMSSPSATTGNIQLVVGISACPSREARKARKSRARSW